MLKIAKNELSASVSKNRVFRSNGPKITLAHTLYTSRVYTQTKQNGLACLRIRSLAINTSKAISAILDPPASENCQHLHRSIVRVTIANGDHFQVLIYIYITFFQQYSAQAVVCGVIFNNATSQRVGLSFASLTFVCKLCITAIRSLPTNCATQLPEVCEQTVQHSWLKLACFLCNSASLGLPTNCATQLPEVCEQTVQHSQLKFAHFLRNSASLGLPTNCATQLAEVFLLTVRHIQVTFAYKLCNTDTRRLPIICVKPLPQLSLSINCATELRT